jgi:hypothetical protein
MWEVVVTPMQSSPRPAAAAWYPLMLREPVFALSVVWQKFFLSGKTFASVNPVKIVNQ